MNLNADQRPDTMANKTDRTLRHVVVVQPSEDAHKALSHCFSRLERTLADHRHMVPYD